MGADLSTELLSPPRQPSHPPRAPTPARQTWVVVVLCGPLDRVSTRALRCVDDAVRDNPGARVLIDLSQATIVSASFLEALVIAQDQAAAAGGRLSLHGATGLTSVLLERWGLESTRPGPPERAA